MPRIDRVVATSFPYYITQRGVRSIPIFTNDDDRRTYLYNLAEQFQRFEVEIL